MPVSDAKFRRFGGWWTFAKDFERTKIYAPFPWWLSRHDTAVWDYRFFFDRVGGCKTISVSPCTEIYVWQGELEHRESKSGYKRTDRKSFVKQLTQIERRKARIRRIRARLAKDGDLGCEPEHLANTPQEHHHIGLAQNRYEHIGTFLRRHQGDPAIQVCISWVATYPTN